MTPTALLFVLVTITLIAAAIRRGDSDATNQLPDERVNDWFRGSRRSVIGR